MHGDHLSPQYLDPPNLGVTQEYLFSQSFPNIEVKRYYGSQARAHGDHLSPQYLHPPNPSSNRGYMSKEPTPWIIPGSAYHQATQTLSPQYLFPPNTRNIVAEMMKYSKQGVTPASNHEVEQKISPQYLFPPNFWSESFSEINAIHYWFVAALTAHLKKQIELKPWSLISLLDRLRYSQRPPFMIPGRINIIFYRLNLLGTVA